MLKIKTYKEPVLNGYVYTIVNSLPFQAVKIRETPGAIIIEHVKQNPLAQLIAEILENAKLKAEKKMPLTGNDKKIWRKLQKAYGLEKDDPDPEIFSKVAQKIKHLNDNDLQQELDNAQPKLAPLSVFRPEHYKAGRAPFFVSKNLERTKPEQMTPLETLLLYSGYLLSRAGYVRIDQKTIDAFILLPLSIQRTKLQFYQIVEDYSQYIPPGVRPEEALYLWITLTLPQVAGNELETIWILALSEPWGNNPSRVDFTLQVNLLQQYETWKKIGIDFTGQLNMWLRLLREALDPNKKGLAKDWAITYSKTLFRALQGSQEAAREALLQSSRNLSIVARSGTLTEEELAITSIATKLSETVFRQLSGQK